LIPCDGHVFVGGFIIDHRLRKPALFLQPIIGLLFEPRYGVGSEEFTGHPLRRSLPGKRLSAVLAEFQGERPAWIGPSTARTRESLGLAHAKERLGALDERLLLNQSIQGRPESAPAASGRMLCFRTIQGKPPRFSLREWTPAERPRG